MSQGSGRRATLRESLHALLRGVGLERPPPPRAQRPEEMGYEHLSLRGLGMAGPC